MSVPKPLRSGVHNPDHGHGIAGILGEMVEPDSRVTPAVFRLAKQCLRLTVCDDCDREQAFRARVARMRSEYRRRRR